MIRKQILLRADLFLLAVAAAPVILPQARFSPLLLAVPLAWVIAWRTRGRALELTPFNTGILLLALMMLISLYATYSIEQSFPKIAGLIFSLGVFFTVVGSIRSRKSYYGMSAGILLAGIGVAVLGVLGSSWIQKVPALIALTKRLPTIAFGLHGAAEGFHPNEVAGVLLWVAPLAMAACVVILAQRKKLNEKIGSSRAATLFLGGALAALAIWGVLILTQSRSGWLGAGLVLLFATTVLLNVHLPFRGRLRLVFWASVGLLLVMGTAYLAPRILDEASSPELEAAAGSALSVTTLASRVEIWSRAVYGIEDFPITGMGMNTFREVVHVLYPLFTIPPNVDLAHAHNHLLQAALDLGLPGLIAYMSLWLTASVMLHKIWSRAPDWEDRLWVLGLGSGLLGYFVYGLTDAVALGAKPGFLWWYLLGLIASLYRLQVSGNRESRYQVTGIRKNKN